MFDGGLSRGEKGDEWMGGGDGVVLRRIGG